jgi:hypothetical protein
MSHDNENKEKIGQGDELMRGNGGATTPPEKTCECKTKYCPHYESDFDKFVIENRKCSCGRGTNGKYHPHAGTFFKTGNGKCTSCSKEFPDEVSTPPSEVSTEFALAKAISIASAERRKELLHGITTDFSGEVSIYEDRLSLTKEEIESVREEAKREVLQEILDFGGDSDEAYQLVWKLKESYLRQ